MMKVRYAAPEDYGTMLLADDGVDFRDFQTWTQQKEVMFVYENEDFCGWLKYSIWKDNIAFLERFTILEPFRGIGNGTLTLLIWERQMMEKMHDTFMLSCPKSDEHTRAFYERHGYQSVGQFTLPDGEEEILYHKHKPLF